ncbi:hypothetical protein OEZ85_007166 [Tetradesmus obliquus]|uniref:Uncharacterized protein n=1 Tax=Tetradesmus obliquus TaxID=3088 RepID=A0ABY8TWX5_TETOB|nr:hypothetical protein OEZ85_007166 [Tetradesmus obliquus]
MGFPRHRGQIVICAASDKDGRKQPEASTPLIRAVKQLAGASALAAVTLAAVVLRDKVTSPIIPPLLPRVERLLPDAPGSNPPSATAAARASTVPAAAAGTDQNALAPAPTADPPPTSTSTAAAAAPTKRPVAAAVLRAVVRPVWGTATLPLRLLDLMLFPDGELISALPQQEQRLTAAGPPGPAAAAAALLHLARRPTITAC